MKITGREIFNILFIGVLGTVLMFLIIQVLFARIISNFIENFSDSFILFLIILGSTMIMLIISVFVGIISTSGASEKSVIKASIFSYICIIVILIILPTGYIISVRPVGSEDYTTLEIMANIPYNIVYFSIFGLAYPIYFFILVSVLYYIIFIIFLERYHKFKPKEYEKAYERYKW